MEYFQEPPFGACAPDSEIELCETDHPFALWKDRVSEFALLLRRTLQLHALWKVHQCRR